MECMKKRITIEVSGEHADEVIQAVADTAVRTAYHNKTNTFFKMYQQILPEKFFRKSDKKDERG